MEGEGGVWGWGTFLSPHIGYAFGYAFGCLYEGLPKGLSLWDIVERIPINQTPHYKHIVP
jgi:hypothetical protein